MRKRNVAYGNINPKEATAIFLRSALVEEDLFPEPPKSPREDDPGSASPSQLLAAVSEPDDPRPAPYPFVEHNRKVRQKIETWQTRARRHDLGDLDAALFEFYARHIENVSSRDELNRFLRGLPSQEVLHVTEAELIGGQDISFDAAAFPDSVPLGGQPVALSYAYTPGEEADGVTLKLGHSLAQALSSASVEWSIPGLREAQVSELLRALPKALRRQLMPFPPKVAEIVRDLRPGNHTLLHDLSRFIQQRYGVEVPVSAWPADALPQHLRPRVEIVGHDRKPIIAGRDLGELRNQLERAKVEPAPAGDPPAWTRLVREWERFGLADWTFGDLPERLTAVEDPKAPLHAWPGLEVEDGQVNLRLFRAQAAARAASVGGIQRLIELAVQKDLGWLQKDLRIFSRLEPLYAGLCSGEDLQAAAFLNLKRHAIPPQSLSAMTRAGFDAAVAQARARLPGLAAVLLARVEPILKSRQDYLRRFKPVPVLAPAPVRARTLTDFSQIGLAPAPVPKLNPVAGELEALVPGDFLARIPFDQLVQIPRYLKALYTRAERAALNPVKDQERARQLAPYREALQRLLAAPPKSEAARQALAEFRWMIEEFKVSLFAQELGTAFPVSPKRLDEQLGKIREG